MTSIHRRLRAVHVFPDGDGGWLLKALSPDGEQLEFELTLARAAQLCSDSARVVMALSQAKPAG